MKKIFLGIKGYIVCLDNKTGKELWRSKLRSSMITNVVYDGDSLYAYCRGHLFSLDPDSGKVLWENELGGLGYGYGIIATENVTNIQNQQMVTAADEYARSNA